ncbi:putative acylaminoacyl-peptidase [Luminiphilus syltensis NOR5-1B]|uniref:Putative acylaminoacyl-peptidase n=1 Tax=Luminiphilus syltensis NOR5-1B TaxID=565045 RepID=B8KUC3_9GAMM|nr:putative acylaminoacyl-peptidase [Luminiphilus syltensis NOR5-1B]
MAFVLFAIFLATAVHATPDWPTEFFSRTEPLGGPLAQPQGSAVAFVISRGANDVLLPFKRSGQLVVWREGAVTTFGDFDSAHDPAWSPSGDHLAFFNGFGSERNLCVTSIAHPNTDARCTPVSGEYQRKSARYLPPIWVENGAAIIVALANYRDSPTPQNAPWGITNKTAKTPWDAHFRDDTLWSITEIDATTGAITSSGEPGPLRRILPSSPRGEKLLLVSANTDSTGVFIGDRWVRSKQFFLSEHSTGETELLPISSAKSITWTLEQHLVFSNSGGLFIWKPELGVQPAPLQTDRPVLDVISGDGWLGIHLAPQTPSQEEPYLIPPPRPAGVQLIDAKDGSVVSSLPSDGEREILGLTATYHKHAAIVHSRNLRTFDESLWWLEPGAEAREIFTDAVSIGGFTTDHRSRVLFFSEHANGSFELRRLSSEKGESHALWKTSAPTEQLDGFRPVEPEVLLVTHPGRPPSKALLYSAPDLKSKHSPAALVVTAYGRMTDSRHQFNPEAQLHVSRGISYLMVDVFPVLGRIGEAYSAAIPQAIAIAREQLGRDLTIGFTGGSLGGFAGLHLLTNTSKFAAAALRAPPSEFAWSWATGKDRDAELLELITGAGSPQENRETYDEDSPLWRAGAIQTPLLLLHGTDDAQVPLNQSIAMFQMLRRSGKTVKIRIYPNADHSIFRDRKDYLIDYYKTMFEWWDRWLWQSSGV